MTKRKLDPKIQLPSYVERRHYACRIRLDLWDSLKNQCLALNCSQGVYLEILLEKALSNSGSVSVLPSDVFKYSSQGERLSVSKPQSFGGACDDD